MNIKRYMMDTSQCACGHCGPVEDPTGEYVLRADLIAAGCLVPVPVPANYEYSKSEPCQVGELVYNENCFILDGQVHCKYGDGEYGECNEGVFEAVKFGGNVPMGKYRGDTIVQPVRLVRLEALG